MRANRTATSPSPSRRYTRLLIAPILTLPVLLAGCSYQQSGSSDNVAPGYKWTSLYRGDVRTVAVPIFANKTFFRGVELDLGKALVGQVEAQTPYKVVPRERADTVIEGQIENIRVRTINYDRVSTLPQEQLYLVRVSFTWKDLRTGKVIVQRNDFEQSAPYYPTLGEGQFVGRQQNVERLALAIVQELQADW